MSERIEVSVVVPTYNRVDRLRRVVDALVAQETEHRTEIVIVSDGSTDGTADYLGGLDPALAIRWAIQDNAGPAAARNRGIQLATGDLILFIDDDVVAGPGLIEAHVEAHRRLGDDVVVIGPMLDPPDHAMSPWIAWEQAKLAEQYQAIQSGVYRTTAQQFYTGNASVRREHLERIGGFDTSFRRAEDVELGQRLQAEGMRFVFEPTAEGFHYAERSFDSWRANAFAYGRNDVIFARRRGDDRVVKVVRHGYFGKNLLTRAVTRATLARPRAAAATQRVLRWLALGAARVGAKPFADLALSGIYITEYHRGTAAELGGHETFFELVGRRHRPHRDT